jgi:hypothetical protein
MLRLIKANQALEKQPIVFAFVASIVVAVTKFRLYFYEIAD